MPLKSRKTCNYFLYPKLEPESMNSKFNFTTSRKQEKISKFFQEIQKNIDTLIAIGFAIEGSDHIR